MNGRIMSKAPRKPSISRVRELRPEYRLDYGKSCPNRFAGRVGDDTVVVLLEPDVAAVFRTSESVNGLLRSVIAALPAAAKTGAPAKARRK
jgi:hypothetical protein